MEMKSAKQEDVKKCRAKQERITIQARDDLFKNKDERHFNLHWQRTECSKLVVNGTPWLMGDDELRTCAKNYFANLAKCHTSVSEPEQQVILHTWKPCHMGSKIIFSTVPSLSMKLKETEAKKKQWSWRSTDGAPQEWRPCNCCMDTNCDNPPRTDPTELQAGHDCP